MLHSGPSPPPFPRYGHSVSSLVTGNTGGELYIFGGLVNDRASNDLYVLQCIPNSPAFVQAARERGEKNLPLPNSINVGLVETKGEVPSPRLGHASVGVGNVLIIWGGDTNSSDGDVPPEPNDNALYLLNLTSRDWTRVKIQGAPEGRYGHAVAMVGSCFYLFGGQSSNTTFLNDLWSFDLQKLKAGNAEWTQIRPSTASPDYPTPQPRTGHTIVTYKDNLYLFGGTDGQYHYNDTWEYNTQTGEWAELTCSGYIPVAREGHAATLVDDVMYVFAGRGVDGKDLEDLAAFKITGADNVARRWFMFQHMGPTPSGRSGHAMATWQSKVYVLGGESYSTASPGYDPHVIHILDSSKIKYPQPKPASNGSAQQGPPLQQLQRKPSPSQSQPPSLTNLQATSVHHGQDHVQPLRDIADQQEELRARTASPPLMQPPRSLAGARGNSYIETPAAQSLAYRAAPVSEAAPLGQMQAPPRPRREDEPARALGPIDQSPKKESLQDMRGLATQQRSVSPAPAALPYPTQQQVTAPLAPPQPTREMAPSIQQQLENQAPQGNPLGMSHMSQSSVRTEKAVQWMLAALAQASSKGFLLPSDASEEELSRFANTGNTDKDKRVLIQALLSVKQEVAKAKASMLSHTTSADERVNAAHAAKNVAVQEAAYYKAKLAALEAGSPEASRVDRDRINDLEAKLSQALTERKAAQKVAAQLTNDLAHERELKESALERVTSASSRVEATETSYSRSLSDYAELQRRVHSHESTIQEHLNAIAQLSSQHATVSADHAHTKNRLDASEETCAHYLKTLEQTHAAFQAANSQAEGMLEQCNTAKAELLAEKQKVATLEGELKQKESELERLKAEAIESGRLLESMKAEREAMHTLTNDSLSQLLNRDQSAAKSRETDLVTLHEAKFRALSEERDSLQSLHSDASTRATTLANDLSEANTRVTALEKAQLSLRSELSVLRARHDASLQEVGKLKSDLAVRNIQISEHSRLAEAAETKVALLRSLMADHGISHDDSTDGSASSSQNAEALVRRVQELEAQLENRTRSQKSLEAAHNESRKGLEQAEQQLRSVSRQHQASEDNADTLRRELERARSPSSMGHGDSSSQAEQELLALQEKHKSLADSHNKAVQYVKGTEKMLRRMKEEVNKHRSRADDLEGQLATARSGNSDSQLKEDFDAMRAQVKDLLAQSQQASQENKELQQRLVTVSADYDAQLKSHEAEAANRIAELEDLLQQLQEDLQKAHREIEETMSINSQLNVELGNALKQPGSRSSNGKTASFNSIIGTSEAEHEVKNHRERIEHLEEENRNLTRRYQVAEQRVAVLLDSMEKGVLSETSSLNGDSHSRTSRLSAELERLDLASGHILNRNHRGGESASDNDNAKDSIDSEELRSEFWTNGAHERRFLNDGYSTK